jgi:hypothetical protein
MAFEGLLVRCKDSLLGMRRLLLMGKHLCICFINYILCTFWAGCKDHGTGNSGEDLPKIVGEMQSLFHLISKSIILF